MRKNHCVVCKKYVTSRQEGLECDRCFCWQHRKCDSGMTREVYRQLNKGNEIAWECKKCKTEDMEVEISAIEPVIEISEPMMEISAIEPLVDDDIVLSDSQHMSYNGEDTPSEMEEASANDPVAEDVSSSMELPVYHIVDDATSRGKPVLFDNIGYSYTLKKVFATRSLWRCSVRNKKILCAATVRQNGTCFVASSREHNHPPAPGSDTVALIRRATKRRAEQQPFHSAGAIVKEALLELLPCSAPCPSLPSIDTLEHVANNYRRARRPKDPTDLHSPLNFAYIKEDFFRHDISANGARSIIFASDSGLALLAKARCWYVDATFKIVKHPFVQLFSIHAFVRKEKNMKQVPLVFALMSRRRFEDYVRVLNKIVESLPSPPECQKVTMDFEMAEWKAFAEVMPSVKRRGCSFHFCQAVYRRAKEHHLTTAFSKDAGAYKLIKKVMALCYMPKTHIPNLFKSLEKKALTQNTKDFMQYFRSTWIESKVWHPSTWSVYEVMVRTNNDVEGWHARINRIGRANMSFYLLISLLQDEADFVTHQVRLVGEKKLKRRQKKSFRQQNDKLYNYWAEYKDGSRSAKQLLDVCSYLTVFFPSK